MQIAAKGNTTLYLSCQSENMTEKEAAKHAHTWAAAWKPMCSAACAASCAYAMQRSSASPPPVGSAARRASAAVRASPGAPQRSNAAAFSSCAEPASASTVAADADCDSAKDNKYQVFFLLVCDLSMLTLISMVGRRAQQSGAPQKYLNVLIARYNHCCIDTSGTLG